MQYYEELFINKIHGDLIKCVNLSNKNSLSFSIILSYDCNYFCNYCIHKLNNMAYTIMLYNKDPNHKRKISNNILDLNFKTFDYKFDLDSLDYFKEIINNLKCDNISVNILGGEPTLYRNIEELIIKLDAIDKLNNINLVTNGSKSIIYYNDLIRLSNKIKFNISYHSEFADNEHFLDLINMFDKNNIKDYSIHILLYDKYYNKIVEFLTMLNDNTKLNNVYLAKLCGVEYGDNNIFYNLLNNKTNNIITEPDYLLTFQDGYEIKIKEYQLLYLTCKNNYFFNNMKCDINKNFWNINNNKIKCLCSDDLIFDIIDTQKFIDYYNSNDYIICNGKCIDDCFVKNTKWSN